MCLNPIRRGFSVLIFMSATLGFGQAGFTLDGVTPTYLSAPMAGSPTSPVDIIGFGVTPTGGFTGKVNFICSPSGGGTVSGAPAPPTCSIPSVDILDANKVSVYGSIFVSHLTSPGEYVFNVTGSDDATGKIQSSWAYRLYIDAPFILGFGGASDSTTATINGKDQSTTVPIQIEPNSGVTLSFDPQTPFSGKVVLACSVTGGSNLPSCKVDGPFTISASSTQAVTATLTITSSPTGTAAVQHSNAILGLAGIAGSASIFAMVLPLPRKRRTLKSSQLILLGCIALLYGGCGGGSHAPPVTTNYVVNVAGADASNAYVTSTVSVKLSVTE